MNYHLSKARVLELLDELAKEHGPVSAHDEREAATELRYRTGNPSVVDALVTAASLRIRGLCIILTTDPDDLEGQVGSASKVRVIGC